MPINVLPNLITDFLLRQKFYKIYKTATKPSNIKINPSRILIVSHHDVSSKSGVTASVKNVFFNNSAGNIQIEWLVAKRTSNINLGSDSAPLVLINGGNCIYTEDGLEFFIRLIKQRLPVLIYWHETSYVQLAVGGNPASWPQRVESKKLFINNLLSLPHVYHLVVSKMCKQLLMFRGIPFEKIFIFHESIPVNEYKVVKRQTKKKYAICSAALTDYRKGFDLFLNLLDKAQERGDRQFTFTWYGGALESLKNEWRGRAERHISEGRLFMPGFVELKKELHKHDIFVLTSRDDPFPIVALEALATDMPVFCYDSVGTAEILPEPFVAWRHNLLLDKMIEYVGNPEAYPPGFFRNIAESLSTQRFMEKWRDLTFELTKNYNDRSTNV